MSNSTADALYEQYKIYLVTHPGIDVTCDSAQNDIADYLQSCDPGKDMEPLELYDHLYTFVNNTTNGSAVGDFLYFDKTGKVSTVDGDIIGTIDLKQHELSDIRGIFNLETVDAINAITEGDLADTLPGLKESTSKPEQGIVIDTHHKKTLQEKIERVKYLQGLPQPEQRSEEWFALRHERLTASDLAGAIGESHYDKPPAILEKKLGGGKPFTGNAATRWGQKYEPVATAVYETRNKVVVGEFGLLPHQTIPFLAASPDGIILDTPVGDVESGTLLEIKCPSRRQITGVIPNEYWIQMQLQLDVCDLDECDFLELKLVEYEDELDYKADVTPDQPDYLRPNGLEKGMLIQVLYKPPGKEEKVESLVAVQRTWPQICEWKAEQIKRIEADAERELQLIGLWGLETYLCQRVARDRSWFLERYPKMLHFWEQVCYYRAVGIDYFYKDNVKPVRRKQLQPAQPELPLSFLEDSDDDTKTPVKRSIPPAKLEQRVLKKRAPKKTATVGFLSDSD